LRVEVKDTGAGMSDDELPRICEAFEQVGPTERRSGGTGLGLRISRQIVALMGGRIHVESAIGQGSRFWFDIVLERAEAQAAMAAPQPRLAAPTAQAGTIPSLTEPASADLVPPPPDQLQVLVRLAKAGKMRLNRNIADSLAAGDPIHQPFAARLKALAASYQSKAILDLVSESSSQSQGA
jgi:hypothetical protein